MAVSLISEADKQAKEARRWKRELQLAGKREKTWRDEADKIVKRYRAEEKKKNRYNVLWSNTETLRPAIYNSRPNPDVRRRFRDADPLGKAVSELLERALMVMVDDDSTDVAIKNDVLDTLLGGRGLSRIRYVPSLKQVSEAQEPKGKDAKPGTDPSSSEDANSYSTGGEVQEEVDYEQICIDHIDWRDYREGYGRTWEEVPCTFYRHKLTKDDAEEKFGPDAIKGVKYAAPADENKDNIQREDVSETGKTAEFWEVWDKHGKRVFFIQEEVKELLYPLDNPDGKPPLDFTGFFPHPDPLMIIENTGSRLPIPPFNLYQSQADELDRISARIDRIVDKMRLRGIYDSKLSEIPDLLDSNDNELTPVENAQAWLDKGLDSALSWFPIEKAAQILESLYEARERQKAIIDELTGVADILRGATDPNETAKAQELKATFGSVRLQRMQREVQRYAKDLLRLASEAMCQKFAPQTFSEMTELQFPTAQQKQALALKIQLAQQQPPQPGSPPPPDPQLLQVPTWEEILQLMRSPSMRRFKVDVETDSTVASTLNSDMVGLSQVLEAIGATLEKGAPLVQSGALPADALKEVVMAIIRRARLGMAVEDAFDKLKAPNPQPPPPMPQVEAAKVKAASDEKLAGIEGQTKAQVAQAEQTAQAQSRQAEISMETRKAEIEAQIEVQKDAQLKEHERQLKQIELDHEARLEAMRLENERLITDATNQTKVLVAEIQANAQAQKQATDLAKTAMQGDQKGAQQDKQIEADQQAAAQEAPTAAAYEPQESAVLQGIKELIQEMRRPKRVVRDDSGKLVGVQ